MSSTQAKIAELEAEYARTQKNKATNYHLGTIKAKLAKLRKELVDPSSGSKGKKKSFLEQAGHKLQI